MKLFRKWSRIIHRDLGFFLIGTSLIYAFSGLALNHLHDWNPSYSVNKKEVNTKINLEKGTNTKENVLNFLDEINLKKKYKSHYYPESEFIKIFLGGGSSVIVNTKTGNGYAEILKKRPLFYDVNYLHYNPNEWWKWFSDFFAVGLILLSISALFMVRGKKGVLGRGGIYTIIGIIIPILFLIFL